MDAATIGVLGAMMTMMLTVMIYLDRARRADMVAGFAAIDRRFDRVDERFVRVDERFGRMDERFDEFTGIVVALAKDVGEVKGRLGDSKPVEAFSGVD